MRVSTILAAGMSALAMAAPVKEKRVYVTDVVIKYFTVTVTAGQPIPTQYRRPNKNVGTRPKTTSVAPVVVVTPTPAPAPVETPKVEAPAPVVSTPQVEAPAPVETPKVEEPAPAKVEPTTAPAPVIVEQPTPTPAAPVVDKVVTPVVGEAPKAPSGGSYKDAVLYHHNVHRSNHSAPDVTFSDELASYAQTVAAKCVWGHDLTPGGGGYGQNIAMTGTSASTESAKDPSVLVSGVISNMWYNGELNLFPASEYGKSNPDMSNFSGWGHFSQVVWKGTTQVGCATHYCKTGTPMFPSRTSGWYTVCNYKQAGNMGGAYGTNVLKPLGKAVVKPVMP